MTSQQFKDKLDELLVAALQMQYSDPIRKDVWIKIREDLTNAINHFNERDR